ncbi:MAG: glycosyltransferase, partial [Ignavibacteriaceae bacterium]|nr:glycosyltransferase [Ignavibacteriaceae bacterium]
FITCLFVLIVVFISFILLHAFPTFNEISNTGERYKDLSIIIAVKDEEDNLDLLFTSLEKLNYPAQQFEVILIDDNSSDNSYQKAIALSRMKTNYLVIKAGNKNFPGKRGAIDIGIQNAKYANIVITDADCIPSQDWLIGYSYKFFLGYDMLFGLAPFFYTKGLVNRLACFENLRNSLLTFSSAKYKLPYSAAARNWGFTISAYERLGKFNNTLETASGDDDLLLREAFKHKLKIGIVDGKNSAVFSHTKSTLIEYITQKSRHTTTSHHYTQFHKLLLGTWHSSNVLLVFSFFLVFINPVYIIPLILKILLDTFVVYKRQAALKYHFRLYQIPFLQLLYEILLIIIFLLSFRKNIAWKQ